MKGISGGRAFQAERTNNCKNPEADKCVLLCLRKSKMKSWSIVQERKRGKRGTDHAGVLWLIIRSWL